MVCLWLVLVGMTPTTAWITAGRKSERRAAANHAPPALMMMSMLPKGSRFGHNDDDDPDPNNRLPLSYRTDNGSRDSEFYLEPLNETTAIEKVPHPFFDIVAQLSPSELTSRFARTAPKYVQDAVRTTILGLLGSIGKYAFETSTITSAERLANMMFQLQMTGYMFKNAEYRLSITESLEGVPQLEPGLDDEEVSEERNSANFPQFCVCGG